MITLIYASIGAKRSNLSNLSAGGRSENLHDFLIDQYGEAGKVHEQNIVKISLELAHHLDKIYSFALDELGIDLAIDDQGKYWMHEANNGPQTGFFEEKRAVNTIAYAKYIAKNGIVRTDNTKYNVPGQFHANTSNPPYVELKDR